MSAVVFIGTFDPLHGAHIGQLLRAYTYKPFSMAYVVVNKNPAHKPNATGWEDRLHMAELTFAAINLPFDYRIITAENAAAAELTAEIDYKITGIDSLLENLDDRSRWPLAQRWPMIVLSIPGIEETSLSSAIASLPERVRPSVRYEYVSAEAAPMMNYDFDEQEFVLRRVHATYIRIGKDSWCIPPTTREYIAQNGLYGASA